MSFNPFEEIVTRLEKIEILLLELKTTNTEIPPEIEFITRQATAEMLGISLFTLNRWTKDGKVIGYRIGSRVRYKKAEVENSLCKIKTSLK